MNQQEQPHVLVVEDNEDVRKVVVIYLRSNGFHVSEAEDGIAGLEMAESCSPDIILFDILLPRLDGIEALKRMRQTPWGEDIPVIMMSAVLQTKDVRAETARMNVSAFLQKPFQVRTLVEEVRKTLREKKNQKLNAARATRRPERSRTKPREADRLSNKTRVIPEYGTLEEYPLPQIIHGLFAASSTGRMRIVVGTTEKRIYFQNGFPVFAESSIPEETLGSHLVAKSKITEEQNAQVRATMNKEGLRFGEAMLKLNLLGPHELFTELEAHLALKVMSTFAWKIGKFKFEEDDSWKDDVIIARMKPGRIILDGVHKYWSRDEVMEAMGCTLDCVAVENSESLYQETHLDLMPRESRVLQLARNGKPLSEFGSKRADLDAAMSTLYGLYVMQFVSIVADSSVSSNQERTRESIDPEITPAKTIKNEENAQELMAEYLKLRTSDYFKLLGVSREATKDEITAAFHERQKRYHPDTLVGIDTGLVHEKIEELFVRVHTAYKTLIDTGSRRRYERDLDGGAKRTLLTSRSKTGKFSTLENKEEHQIQFEDAFSFLRNGDFDRALPLFKKAESLVQKPRYCAYRVWTEYLVNSSKHGSRAEKELLALYKANSEEPLMPYLLGNYYLREKNNKKAIVFFEKALDVDPQHIDSARQLRILRMRQRSETSGLFDLFKKK